MGRAPKMTLTTQALLAAMLDSPGDARYGFELSAATGLASGTVHPILARLEGLGWVESFWEDIDPRQAGRPRRRYYRLGAHGVEAARASLARAHAERSRIVSRLRPAVQT